MAEKCASLCLATQTISSLTAFAYLHLHTQTTSNQQQELLQNSYGAHDFKSLNKYISVGNIILDIILWKYLLEIPNAESNIK